APYADHPRRSARRPVLDNRPSGGRRLVIDLSRRLVRRISAVLHPTHPVECEVHTAKRRHRARNLIKLSPLNWASSRPGLGVQATAPNAILRALRTPGHGIAGQDFVDNRCKKLLSYGIARSLQLSVTDMRSALLWKIVTSAVLQQAGIRDASQGR